LGSGKGGGHKFGTSRVNGTLHGEHKVDKYVGFGHIGRVLLDFVLTGKFSPVVS
jgi:hypothetical protein